MGRRKSVAELQRQLKYAQAREAAPKTDPDPTGAIRKRSKTPVKYGAIFDTTLELTVQASTDGLQFFGGLAALGLADAGTEPKIRAGDRPAMVMATVADATPTRLRAQGSNRPYIRYGRGTRGGGTQYNFSAPISADTAAALRTRFNTVADSVKPRLGGEYGRVWFEPERLLIVESGGQ